MNGQDCASGPRFYLFLLSQGGGGARRAGRPRLPGALRVPGEVRGQVEVGARRPNPKQFRCAGRPLAGRAAGLSSKSDFEHLPRDTRRT